MFKLILRWNFNDPCLFSHASKYHLVYFGKKSAGSVVIVHGVKFLVTNSTISIQSKHRGKDQRPALTTVALYRLLPRKGIERDPIKIEAIPRFDLFKENVMIEWRKIDAVMNQNAIV